MFEKLTWVISGVRPVGWMGCMLVGCSYFLITRWNAFAEGAEESELWVWNSHLLCVWAWVNSIIISEAVIMCPSIGRAVVGPPCFRQQVQLTIWQLTPMEGVIQTSRGWVDPVRACRQSEPKPTNQQTSDTGGERKQHGGGGGDQTDGGRPPHLAGVGQSCRLSFVFM